MDARDKDLVERRRPFVHDSRAEFHCRVGEFTQRAVANRRPFLTATADA
jgi:hypothetical protein